MVDYDPIRFIYPEENTTIVFNSIDSKSVECITTGSLVPHMTWIHESGNELDDLVRRVYTVNTSIGTPPYIYKLQLNIISPVPYTDAGEYVCIVRNKWETVNRSISLVFELLRGSKKGLDLSLFVIYFLQTQIHSILPRLLHYSTCLNRRISPLDVLFKLTRLERILEELVYFFIREVVMTQHQMF